MARANLNPTPKQRAEVRNLVGWGLTQAQICAIMGVRSIKTLRLAFREELLHGRIQTTMAVQDTLFKLASSGRNPDMTMFWLRTRAKWSRNMKSEPVSQICPPMRELQHTVGSPERLPMEEEPEDVYEPGSDDPFAPPGPHELEHIDPDCEPMAA